MREQTNANWHRNGIQVTKLYQVSRNYYGVKTYTERQLSFRRDSLDALIKKFNDKKYRICRPLIAKEMECKKDNLRRRLDKMIDSRFHNKSKKNATLIELKTRYDCYIYVLEQIESKNLAA